MDLAAARQDIETCFARMNALYLRPVFDEWAIFSLSARQGILAYSGPRAEQFRQSFPNDVEPLRALLAGRPFGPGEFEFAPDAEGTRYDACLKVGLSSFLICNHTERAIAEIRKDPRWLNAQTAFFELCEKFRSNPLEV